jgi:hypothetical protein
MTPETREAGGRFLLSALTVASTIVASSFGLDYRASERSMAVHDEVKNVTAQNSEILQGIAELLDKKLEATAKMGETNEALNRSLIEKADGNRALNSEILKRLEKLESKVGTKP